MKMIADDSSMKNILQYESFHQTNIFDQIKAVLVHENGTKCFLEKPFLSPDDLIFY